MSLIAGLNYALFGIMIADSRLTWQKTAGTIKRDVCQKLFPFTGAGLMSWCGHVDTARFVMRLVVEEKDRSGPWFVLSPQRVLGVLNRSALRSAPHGVCNLIVQLINPEETAFEGEYWPRIDMSVIEVRVNAAGAHVTAEPSLMSAQVRGSGSFVVNPMKQDRFHAKIYGASSAAPDLESAVINKALFAEREIRAYVEARREETIGGLYQIAYLLKDRVRAISYDRWVRCGGAMGTWATLAIRDGRSYQEHGPTSRSQLLMNPFVEPIEDDFGTDLLFELERLSVSEAGMTKNSRRRVGSRFRSAHGVAGAPEFYRPLFVPSPPATD
ncbi:MAG: hypothetical protein M3P30_04020 [Chloroflexota bacterium]|nr:hypothetical protein [Chloroflexota bacterium]